MKKVRVIVVGPDPIFKGGISTLIGNMLKYENEFLELSMHIARPEGNFLKKIILVPFYTSSFLFRVLFVKYDIVHIHTSENWGFYRYIPLIFIARCLRIKIIIHSHASDFDSFFSRQKGIIKKIIKNTLDSADIIIALSPELSDVFRKITRTKIIVVFNFIEVPGNNYYSIYSKIILTAGYISKRKGYYDIIKVIPAIVTKNSGIKFRFCGNGETGEILEEIEKLHVSQNIDVSGWISNSKIVELMKESMIFVLPSYNEGMPMAILEAMSYGLPIISTNVGGIPSVVKNGINGIILEPGKTDELEAAIDLLVSDNDMRMMMSNNNYSKVKNEFSIECGMNKIYNQYLDLCN